MNPPTLKKKFARENHKGVLKRLVKRIRGERLNDHFEGLIKGTGGMWKRLILPGREGTSRVKGDLG